MRLVTYFSVMEITQTRASYRPFSIRTISITTGDLTSPNPKRSECEAKYGKDSFGRLQTTDEVQRRVVATRQATGIKHELSSKAARTGLTPESGLGLQTMSA
jgi:hypothetical protein